MFCYKRKRASGKKRTLCESNARHTSEALSNALQKVQEFAKEKEEQQSSDPPPLVRRSTSRASSFKKALSNINRLSGRFQKTTSRTPEELAKMKAHQFVQTHASRKGISIIGFNVASKVKSRTSNVDPRDTSIQYHCIDITLWVEDKKFTSTHFLKKIDPVAGIDCFIQITLCPKNPPRNMASPKSPPTKRTPKKAPLKRKCRCGKKTCLCWLMCAGSSHRGDLWRPSQETRITTWLPATAGRTSIMNSPETSARRASAASSTATAFWAE